jgi:hypothetical protein
MMAFHWNHTCSLQLFLTKNPDGVSRQGGIMNSCPRGSHHQLKSRHFAWVRPSETITRNMMVYCSHFGNVHHDYVSFICQLVPRVKYASILSHVCCSSFRICCVVLHPWVWNLWRQHSGWNNACILERCHLESYKTGFGESSSIHNGCLWRSCFCISQVSLTNTLEGASNNRFQQRGHKFDKRLHYQNTLALFFCLWFFFNTMKMANDPIMSGEKNQ